MTLEQRTRDLIAAEGDDFYDDQNIVDYLNSVLVQMVSRLNSIERDSSRSLRALDRLRETLPATTSGIAAYGSFYNGTIAVPQDLLQIQYVEYNNQTPLTEISVPELNSLRWSNAVPTSAEGYYVHTRTGGDRVIRYFVHRNDNNLPLVVVFLKQPRPITNSSTTILDLPQQFIPALLFGAAEQASIKENAREAQDNALAYRKYTERYEKEFQAAIY
jgi:hypothetical protein